MRHVTLGAPPIVYEDLKGMVEKPLKFDPFHLRACLTLDGAVVIPGVLSPSMLGRLRNEVQQQVRVEGLQVKATVAETLPFRAIQPVYRDLIWWTPAHVALDRLGLRDLRWFGGAVIPKPAGEPRRPWHQDWWAWQDPSAHWLGPPQVGLLYYLHETTEENGALVILPGSHRKRVALHNYYRIDPTASGAQEAEEKALPTKPGDMVVLDARCLHASRPMGEGGPRRDLLTVWYVNEWYAHTPALQASVYLMAGIKTETLLGPFHPTRPDGETEPLSQDYEARP